MNHPCVKRSQSCNYEDKKHSGPFNLKSLLDKAIAPAPSPNYCLPCSPVPPWENVDQIIFSNFSNISKDNVTENSIKQIFNDLHQNKFNNHIAIYTDGSKSDNKTSSAVVVPSQSYTKTTLLPNYSSVLTSELVALLNATEYCKKNKHLGKFVIYSDSQSAITLLQTKNPDSYKYLTHKILNIIIDMKNEIFIQWIPAHKGIPGNEEADALAKTVETGPISLIPVPTEDYFCLLKNKINRLWLQEWHHEVIKGKGRDLYEIKKATIKWPWARHVERIIETSIARLRVGHAGLGQYRNRFGFTDSPLCQCGEVETIEHFLLLCPILDQLRFSLKQSLLSENINFSLSLKLLLGGSDLPLTKQLKIRNHLGLFLKESGKIEDI